MAGNTDVKVIAATNSVKFEYDLLKLHVLGYDVENLLNNTHCVSKDDRFIVKPDKRCKFERYEINVKIIDIMKRKILLGMFQTEDREEFISNTAFINVRQGSTPETVSKVINSKQLIKNLFRNKCKEMIGESFLHFNWISKEQYNWTTKSSNENMRKLAYEEFFRNSIVENVNMAFEEYQASGEYDKGSKVFVFDFELTKTDKEPTKLELCVCSDVEKTLTTRVTIMRK